MVSQNIKSNSNFEEVLQKLHGLPFMRPAQAKWLNKLITTKKLYSVLEIGFHHGKSTALIAATLADAGQGELISIDRNLSLKLVPEAGELLRELNLDVTVKLIHAERSYTWELSKLIAMDHPPKFDICYFDAGHEWDSTALGFLLVDRLIKPGGWIVFDDLDWTIQNSLKRRGLIAKATRFHNYSQDEISTPAVRRVFELLVPTEGYEEIQSVEGLGWGVARKKSAASGQYATLHSNPDSNEQNIQATKIIKRNHCLDNSINSQNDKSLNWKQESIDNDAGSIYKYTLCKIINSFSPYYQSIVDVDSGGAYLEWFPNFAHRVVLDKGRSQFNDGIKVEKADLLSWHEEKTFDIALCLQKIENVLDASTFAKRLLSIAKVVVISVPFTNTPEKESFHIHDYITDLKIYEWFGKKANYKISVKEVETSIERVIYIYDRSGKQWNCTDEMIASIKSEELTTNSHLI